MKSCDHLLALQEVLLCTADKLASVGDGVVPIDLDLQFLGFPGSRLAIPVQAERDKFIVRDMAINTLAHLAELEFERPVRLDGSGGNLAEVPHETCTDTYLELLSSGDVDLALPLFGEEVANGAALEYFEPLEELTTDNARRVAEARLNYKAHVLRSAGRLLRNVLDKSLQADMAGAEQQRAAAGDPLRGAALMWGREDGGFSPYNSLGHAMRLLFGRWELAARFDNVTDDPPDQVVDGLPYFGQDPECNGFRALVTPVQEVRRPELKDLVDALGPGFTARWHDIPVSTDGQALATSLVNDMGVVWPPEGRPDPEAIRTTLGTGSIFRAAQSAGLLDEHGEHLPGVTEADVQEFFTGPVGEIHRHIFAQLSDEDLAFGLDRGWDAFRLLADVPKAAGKDPPELLAELAHEAGLRTIPDADILALIGRIPRDDLFRDAFARAVPAQAASQCPEYLPHSTLVPTAPHVGAIAAFQNVFSLADTLRRRIGVIRDGARSASGGDTELVRLGELAVAELRSWSGPGRVYYIPIRDFHDFVITGITPDWFELDPARLADLEDRLSLLYGRPLNAECMAGLRQNCPSLAAVKASMVGSPTLLTESHPAQARVGNDGEALYVRFSFDAPSNGEFHESLLHLVLNAEPRSTRREGRVLATFAPRAVGEMASEVVSDYQRHLANRVLGIAKPFRRENACVGDDSTTSSRGYCIAGVERDFFVPLANELTSQSPDTEDSWRHYLRLAEEAAARVDELGRQIIELGLQRDLRREAAQEELGQLCGSFLAADDLVVQEGSVRTGRHESANACFEEDRYDVVFLGHNPFRAESGAEQQTISGEDLELLRSFFCEGSSSGFCDPAKTTLRVAALGLGTDAQDLTPVDCEEITTGTITGEPLAAHALRPYGTSDALETALYNLRYVEWPSGAWVLRLRDEIVMASIPDHVTQEGPYEPPLDPTTTYPLCLNFADGSRCHGRAQAFQRMFPWPNELEVGRGVQRAMILMGAMVGRLPRGRLMMSVPAVNFAFGRSTRPTPAPAVYGHSRFTFDDVEEVWRLDQADGATEVDDQWFGKGRSAPEGFAQRILNVEASQVIPGWYENLLQDIDENPTDYVLKHVANDEVVFKPSSWSGSPANFIQRVATRRTDIARAFEDVTQPSVCVWSGIPVFRETPASTLGLDVFDIFWPEEAAEAAAVVPPFPPVQLNAVVPGVSSGGRFFPDANSCFRLHEGVDPGWLTPECARDEGSYDGIVNVGPSHRFEVDGSVYHTNRVTLPSRCSPAGRVAMFMSRLLSQDAIDVNFVRERQILANALGLSCLAGGGLMTADMPDPPQRAETVGDLSRLARWTQHVAAAADGAVNALFLENVPTRVVEAFLEGRVANVGITGEGQHGQIILKLRGSLERIHGGWMNAASGLRQLGNALDSATVALELGEIGHQARLLDIASAQVRLDRDLAMAAVSAKSSTLSGLTGIVSSAVTGGAVGGPAAAAFGAGAALLQASASISTSRDAQAVSRQAAERERRILREQSVNADLAHMTQQQQVFADLAIQTEDLHRSIGNALSQIRESTGETLQLVTELQNNENQARWEAAKAAGADFVRLESGEVVPLPVNTVLRRQYDITRRRYDDALHRAKRLAYMARLAIEQRIGVRMHALREPIGALEAPSLWADDVCSLQGIDYAALRTAARDTTRIEVDGAGGGGQILIGGDDEEALIGQFADAYIGDYVQKLKEFVEFYNIAAPFHEADDRAVVSLRERLIGRSTGCTAESRNLLHFSDRLFRGSPHSAMPSEGGWELHPCAEGEAECLQVRPMPGFEAVPEEELGLLVDGNDTVGISLSPPGGVGNASWLAAVPADEEIPPGSPSGLLSPPGSVYQSVLLSAGGHYALSWWDMALTGEGHPDATGQARLYQASVYDEDWNLVTVTFNAPHAGNGDWSRRRVLDFVAPVGGWYYVTFQLVDSSGSSSFAIANVQLEAAAPGDGFATGYESTGDSRVIFTADCTDSPATLREAFRYRCDRGTCFYELRDSFAINTTELDSRTSNVSGLVGAGNYNHRHRQLAVNIVGTGVLDCTQNPSASCFGQGYLEYDLVHDAYDVPILDHGRQARCFTFGTGAVRGGKALSTERYITMPLSSADESLISQPGFLRPELAGRPLSGTYRLRIIDNPALDWERIDDIQIVLGYRVWSRVTRTQAGL